MMKSSERAAEQIGKRPSRSFRARQGGEEDAQARAEDAPTRSSRGVLEVHGGRVIVMTEQAYILLLQVLNEHAPEAMKYAFYDMGYRAGIDIMAAVAERPSDPETAFRHFVEQYTQAGYGNLEVTYFDLAAPEALLSGTNLFEAGLAPKAGIYRSPRAVDHYSQGIFAGFLSELLKREVVCEEVACQFRGDPRCKFVVLPFQE